MRDAEIQLGEEPAPLAPPSAAEAAMRERERERMGDVHIQVDVEPAPLAPPSAAEEATAAAGAEAGAGAEAAEMAEAATDPDMIIRCLKWNPLHVAASRGHQQVFQALLNGNPELAEAVDSQQRSPLHLASANGHIEIVEALIAARPEMCLARDRDGANPLHVAAMRGQVEVLDALFQANRNAARARVDSGEKETILHLCVKYNQPEFLKRLLRDYFKGADFVNAQDNDGNTILHLAVADRRLEIVKNVLSDTEIYVDAINAYNQRALDILFLEQKKGSKLEGVDRDIESLLQLHRAIAQGKFIWYWYLYIWHWHLYDPTEIAEKRNGIIVASALFATLAFQSAVAPPGGLWQDTKDGHEIGKAVMAFNHPFLYTWFMGSNSAGFFSSLLTIYFVVLVNSGQKTDKNLVQLFLAMASMASTGVNIIATYVLSLIMVSPSLMRPICHGKNQLPGCRSDRHLNTALYYLSTASAVSGFLIGVGVGIWPWLKIRKYAKRVNQARLANPAPAGEAPA